MIAIVNYGVGNLFSLSSSLRYLGIDCIVTNEKREIEQASHVILPGVGAFGDAAEKLRACGLDQVVVREAEKGKPLLGICLGMQLLYGSSCEYGRHNGLGLVPGQITGLREALGEKPLKVPHMGWNGLEFLKHSPLLKYSEEGDYVYYVHSFYAAVGADTVACSTYGPVKVTGIVERGNVFGTQFHPEKSGKTGLAMLRAFSEL